MGEAAELLASALSFMAKAFRANLRSVRIALSCSFFKVDFMTLAGEGGGELFIAFIAFIALGAMGNEEAEPLAARAQHSRGDKRPKLNAVTHT